MIARPSNVFDPNYYHLLTIWDAQQRAEKDNALVRASWPQTVKNWIAKTQQDIAVGIAVKLGIAALVAGAMFGQGQAVNQVGDPPPTAELKLFYYDGSSNLQYICWARQNQGQSTTQKRSDSTLTSIVDSSNTSTITTASAHGLYIGARVTISGATVDTDLNGTYTVVTVGSSTTYTITTANVSDATYTESTLVITTSYPLTTAPKWAIQVLTYTSTTLTASYWANASVGYGLACTDRTTY